MHKRITETIGIDLGDRFSWYCVLDQDTGVQKEEGEIATTRESFHEFLSKHRTARVVMEAGTHSPWASRVVEGRCAQSLVANPRELSFIYRNTRKSDRTDAKKLAEIGRFDPQLLAPIRHRPESAQRDLALIRARAALVSSRTKLVNSLRGVIKSMGGRLRKQASKCIGTKTRAEIPEELYDVLSPLLGAIERITELVKIYDAKIDELANERYPDTQLLTQIPGVGNLTALAFMLTVQDWARFEDRRDVGAFLGMVPRRDQSGQMDKQLRITKAGDRMVRSLLVQCAHHILGRLGPPCDLKSHGERIIARGGAVAKRKAVIAVARKLSVLMLALWRTGEEYIPVRCPVAA